MGLIINKSITKLMKGYPTVSDKYNVKGGILEGTENVVFGQLVQFGSATGYYKAISATSTVDAVTKIAGFVLATNVKLVTEYAGTKVETLPGEAFNLLLSGYIAVEIASGLTIKEGDKVYATSAGVITNVSTNNFDLNAKFTGITETVGDKVLAEIRVLFK